MTLFVPGAFTSHSGQVLQWKIECDALTDEDWECLAVIIVPHLEPFGLVRGIPEGGLIFASKLRAYSTESKTVLIVDDVLTTGRSMMNEGNNIGTRDIIGAVAFARGPCPNWITPACQILY